MLQEIEVTKKDSALWAIMFGAAAIMAVMLLLGKTNDKNVEAFNRESQKIHAAALARQERESFLAQGD